MFYPFVSVLALCATLTLVSCKTGNLRNLQSRDNVCQMQLKMVQLSNGEDEKKWSCAFRDQIKDIEGLSKEFLTSNKIISGSTLLELPTSEFSSLSSNGATLTIASERDVVVIQSNDANISVSNTVDGAKSTLVVRIIANDDATTSSKSELSDSIFGTNGDVVNLSERYDKCSDGQLTFVPAVGNDIVDGVGEVTIVENVAGADNSVIRNAATVAATTKYGDLSTNFDYVILCIPPGTTSSSGSWIAYAYVNGYLSVYNDNWCEYPSGLVHEIGHNLGLLHSNENGAYQDKSGLMGYSYSNDEGPLMCFNAAKNWQLGWYVDRAISIPNPFFERWSGTLVGLSDFTSEALEDEIVIVRLEFPAKFYYVSFNRKTGINSGTNEAGNQVLVHSAESESGESELLAKLSNLGVYTEEIEGKTLIVEVTNMDLISDPGTADVSIRVGCEIDDDCDDGVECNGVETCNSGSCERGEPSQSERLYSLALMTDSYGSETSWDIKDADGGPVASGGNYPDGASTLYEYSECLDAKCYTFTVRDSYGDGFCCGFGSGYYNLKWNSVLVASGGTFQSSESEEFGDCTNEPITESPTEAPVSKNPTGAPISTGPTGAPVSEAPTDAPVSTTPTEAPVSAGPTDAPASAGPTDAPVSAIPTEAPVSAGPTESPISDGPTNSPVSTGPTISPVSANPTGSPLSAAPTYGPISTSPTDSPVTDGPTEAPVSATPTGAPVVGPSEPPVSAGPSDAPVSAVPTESPISTTPTDSPISETPTDAPVSTTPTDAPVSETPTESPVSATPTESPVTSSPVTPTVTPTDAPISTGPTDAPISSSPTGAPASAIPTNAPVSGSPIVAPNCPPAFSDSVQYSAGDEVTVENKIYKCKPFPYTGWCSQGGYQPGASANWSMAWTRNGDCNAQPPVSSPTCPPTFSASETYAANDRVSVNKNIYKCMAFPDSQWCDMAGYEPGTSLYWTSAWDTNGVCPNDDSNYVLFFKFKIQEKKKNGTIKPILRFYVRNEENKNVANAKIVVTYTPDVGNVVERGCTSNRNGVCKVVPPFFSAQASSVSVKLISVVSSFGDINLDENVELDGCPLFSDACTELPILF